MTTIRNDNPKLVYNFILIHAPKTQTQPTITTNSLSLSPSAEEDLSADLPQQQANISLPNHRKYHKDDYQKNITINIVKCCIRQMLGQRYKRLLSKKCEKMEVQLNQLLSMVEPILKEVVISLGDLKYMLTTGNESELKLKKVFCWFLQWYLRNRYMFYLLKQGKVNLKERYIEYKNKYILSLLELIRENREINSPIRTLPQTPQEQQ